MVKCAREKLQQMFNQYLAQNYSDLTIIDMRLAASQWVSEQGTFINGTGQAISVGKCELCGQRPKVLEDGNLSSLQGELSCQISPQPVIGQVSEFNK